MSELTEVQTKMISEVERFIKDEFERFGKNKRGLIKTAMLEKITFGLKFSGMEIVRTTKMEVDF